MVQEPDAGTAYAEVTLLRAPGSSHAVAVFYTADGSATAGADYGKIFRMLLVFGQNELSRKVLIPIYADALSEGDETVLLSLRNPTGGKVRGSPDTATLVIKDEDVPQVYLFGSDVTEGDPIGSGIAPFGVILDRPAPAGGVTVQWETVSLTARSEGAADFTVASGTITFLAGTVLPVAQPMVTITWDNVSEVTEKFAVRLKNPVRATVAEGYGVAIATIYDDDLRPITGTVFHDVNGNGFVDIGEKGIEAVAVTISWTQGGVAQSETVLTNASGVYTSILGVTLGQVSISVDNTTVKSPYQKAAGPLSLLVWSGAYATTTNNEVQSEEFDGIVGISPFGPVGYKNSRTISAPEDADDVGRGGTDDMIFGGPGNDLIDGGAGDDHIVGGHWQTATDSNMPINKATYDAVVVVVTDDTDLPAVYGLAPGTVLHSIYDDGPIFSVTPEVYAGVISGDIWLDVNGNNYQLNSIFPTVTFDPLFTGEVLVHLWVLGELTPGCPGNTACKHPLRPEAAAAGAGVHQ